MGIAGPVLLLRHAEVALRWRGRCYGRTNVGLSQEGQRRSRSIALALAQRHAGGIVAVIHSGTRRAAFLAHEIARLTGAALHADPRWRERDFGSWEGRTWHAIWRETGNAMEGMLTDPQDFRPGGGETTAALHARSLAAWRELPVAGLTVVVAHGGPIACVRGHLAGAPWHRLPEFTPATGELIEILR